MQITEQAVRERAYYIWEGEGRLHGKADAHWMRAEAELSVVAPAKSVARAPVRKAEGAAKVAKLAAKAAPAPVAVPLAAPVSPARKSAKPKSTAGAAVAAASVSKAKPARARTGLH